MQPIDYATQQRFWDTALRTAPALYMDKNEPFFPIRVGISIIEETGPSPSSDRTVEINTEKVQAVIEYAIYWDYDIEHLYDLEHVWLYIGHDGEIVSCEASFHGKYLIGLLSDRSNLTEDNRVRLYVQPGKHAMLPLKEGFRLSPNVEACCNESAGSGGLLEPAMFKGEFTPEGAIEIPEHIHELSKEHLLSFRFAPSFEYELYQWTPELFVPWEELRKEIPVRMKQLVTTLAEK